MPELNAALYFDIIARLLSHACTIALRLVPIKYNFNLFTGERLDVVVRMDQPTGGYWVEVSGEGPCEGIRAHAMLLYSGFNYTSMMEEGAVIFFLYYFISIFTCSREGRGNLVLKYAVYYFPPNSGSIAC